MNLKRFKYGVGLLVTFDPGVTGTVNVEVSGDSLSNQVAGSASGAPENWNLHDILQGLTASKNSSLAYPVTAIRLNPSSLTVTIPGNGVTLQVIEAEG
jgi:hypothetical protein